MEDRPNNTINEVVPISAGELVPGDHNSILLFGADIQAKLQNYSKSISEILIHGNAELEDRIRDTIEALNEIAVPPDSKGLLRFFVSQEQRQRSIIRKYNTILDYVDKLSLALKLQQAQLLKDTKVLEQLLPIISGCHEEINQCLENGQKVLERQKSIVAPDNSDLNSWIHRLEGKINDLILSRTITTQCEAQIGLMVENNRVLIDRIISALTNTIPAWRTQVTLLLGLEKHKQNTLVQEKILTATKNPGDSKRKTKNTIELDKLDKINHNLLITMNELADYEIKDDIIKKELSDITI